MGERVGGIVGVCGWVDGWIAKWVEGREGGREGGRREESLEETRQVVNGCAQILRDRAVVVFCRSQLTLLTGPTYCAVRPGQLSPSLIPFLPCG
jgi:hypothetical protein